MEERNNSCKKDQKTEIDCIEENPPKRRHTDSEDVLANAN